METTLQKFIEEIEASPLGFIRGNCRLVSHLPNEYPLIEIDTENDTEKFFEEPHQPIISFSYKEKFLGEIKLKFEMIETCDFSDQKGPNLTLDIREDQKTLVIFIKCPESAGFPYLEEFGEFIAYKQKEVV